MVSVRRCERRGASSFGCLVSIILLVAVLYYGYHVGQVYLKFYQLQDEMNTQASLAPSLADDVIYRRLSAKSDSLLGRSLRFAIQRAKRITITTEYSDSVDLPFFKHTFRLKPKAEAPL
jgi:hypothetical protein